MVVIMSPTLYFLCKVPSTFISNYYVPTSIFDYCYVPNLPCCLVNLLLSSSVSVTVTVTDVVDNIPLTEESGDSL